MGLFAYQAVDGSGKLITGRVEAEEEWAAVDRLRKTGLTVVEIKTIKPPSPGGYLFNRKVKVGDLALFSRQLAAMLNAGIPLTRCLFTLRRQVANPVLQKAVDRVAQEVEGGAGFAEALAAHPDVFPLLYVNMIRAGEVGGTLVEVVRRLSGHLEQEKTLRDQIRTATFYPLTVIAFAFLVTMGMLFFIVPLFVSFFPPGMTLPLPTRLVIAFSDSLRLNWYLWLGGAAGLVLFFRFYLRSPAGGLLWDRVKFRFPVLGTLFQRTVMARFSRTLSTLLAGGIPVLQALEAAGPTAGSIQVAEAVRTVAEKVEEGKSIAAPLEESGLFPPLVTQMVAVGEESGNLPELLTKVAEFYEAEVAALAKGLTSLIEPVLIIIIGCLVAFIVISMYLPIFLAVTSVGR